MAENELENTQTFRRSITAADGTGIIEILNCADCFTEYDSLATSYHLGKSFYLEALSGACYLPSYLQAPFAEIYPEMNGAERIAALLKIEEDFPFVGLRFHAKKGTAGAWSTLGTARLQNKGREITIPFTVPYLTVNQLKMFGSDDRLGISIFDYGHGVLGSGDYINLEGDFKFVTGLIAKPQTRVIGPGLPYGVNISTGSPTRFRATNANRAILYATNVGNSDIWIAGNDSVAVGNGLFLGANGGGNLTEQTLTGELWAIAESGTSRICGIEASYV
jgi:hypothetical protein